MASCGAASLPLQCALLAKPAAGAGVWRSVYWVRGRISPRINWSTISTLITFTSRWPCCWVCSGCAKQHRMTLSRNKLYTYAHNLPPEPKRFVKFLFIGTLGFAVDFGLFNLIHTFYDVPGTKTDELIAQAISFTCAVFS